MSDTTLIRYSVSADKAFDKELRETVHNISINTFFIEAARKEIQRLRKAQAMQQVRELPDPFPAIADPSAYIQNLRTVDDEHRQKKRAL